MRDLEAEAGLHEEKAVLGKVFLLQFSSLTAPFLSADEGEVLCHAEPLGGVFQAESTRGS